MSDPVISTMVAILMSISYCDEGNPIQALGHIGCADGSTLHHLEIRVAEGHNCKIKQCDIDTLFELVRDGEIVSSIPSNNLITMKEREQLNKVIEQQFEQSSIPLHIKK